MLVLRRARPIDPFVFFLSFFLARSGATPVCKPPNFFFCRAVHVPTPTPIDKIHQADCSSSLAAAKGSGSEQLVPYADRIGHTDVRVLGGDPNVHLPLVTVDDDGVMRSCSSGHYQALSGNAAAAQTEKRRSPGPVGTAPWTVRSPDPIHAARSALAYLGVMAVLFAFYGTVRRHRTDLAVRPGTQDDHS